MTLIVCDPTGEHAPQGRTLRPRPDSLTRTTVGLLDIAKPRGDRFLDRLAELLTERGARVRRYAKPTYAKPAPIDIRREIATECEVVIEALAD
jgi:hypothetical protein